MRVYKNNDSWVIESFLDDDLIDEIKIVIQDNLDNLPKNKDGYSTQGKNAEQYWIIDHQKNFFIEDSRFFKFEERYRNKILNTMKASTLFDEEKQEEIKLNSSNAWTVIGEENSYHTMHCHNGGSFEGISTLVYLEVPETNVENDPENSIFLATNVSPKNPYYYNNVSSLTINPEVGKFLIFPDWILHGTYPQTKGIRQSFNIDYKLSIFKDYKLEKLSYH
mgnify:CR=1 FL=1|jgi:hypothetical protein|tara:strand:- start:738 stop:1400 length:663 start_codon:yes stop_codon:yes gene_type:complete